MPNTYVRAAAEGMPAAKPTAFIGRFSRRALLGSIASVPAMRGAASALASSATSQPADASPVLSAAETPDERAVRLASELSEAMNGFMTLPGDKPQWVAHVTTCGRICYNRKKINLSLVFAGQTVGIKQVEDHIWLASFMDYDLGYFDDETCRLEPLQNPFGPKVLPMSPV